MRAALTIVALTALGCARAEAPSELGDLAVFFFAEAEADDALLADGFANLGDLLAAMDYDAPNGERTFELAPLDPTGLDPIPEGVRWENQNPVGGAGLSAHPILHTVTTARLTDQRPVQSESSVVYDRTFDTDVECFIARACDTLEVSNSITKESPIATLPYELPMTYRWVELADGRLAYFVRGWMAERSPGADPDHWFDQNYHSELWIEHPSDPSTTLRWISVWSSVTIPGVTDTFAAGQVELAIHDAYERADAWLADP